MTEPDEQAFAKRLREIHPGVSFIKNSERLEPDIEFHDCPTECTDWYVWIHNEDLVSSERRTLSLNSKEYWQGLPLIQFLRPRYMKDTPVDGCVSLKNGRLAFSSNSADTSPEIQFAKSVWSIAKKASCRVDCVNPINRQPFNQKVAMCYAWPGAAAWATENRTHFLKSENTAHYYLPTVVNG